LCKSLQKCNAIRQYTQWIDNLQSLEESSTWTPLHMIAQEGLSSVYKQFSSWYELGLDLGTPNSMNDNNETPLHLAARNGHRDVVELLQSGGEEVDAKDNAGKTALHWASEGGHKDVVELLLSRGADVSEKDQWGKTALYWASVRGDRDVVELLLSHGADVDAK